MTRLHCQRLVERKARSRGDGGNGVRERERALRRHLLGEGARGIEQRFQMMHTVREADLHRPLAIHHACAQNHLEGASLANQPRQSLRAAIARDEAELHFREPELRRGARQSHVAGERELAAATEAEAVDRRNHRLIQPLDAREDLAAMRREGLKPGGAIGAFIYLCDVRTRDERATCTGKDDCADIRARREVREHAVELVDNLRIQRIELVLAVDRDDRHAVGDVELEKGEVHGSGARIPGVGCRADGKESIHSDVTLPIVATVQWAPDGALRIVDQRLLPNEFVERDLRTIAEVAEAIRTLAVRGAPAIGVSAAMGLAAAVQFEAPAETVAFAREGAAALRATRPTAVNLMWALDRMLQVIERTPADRLAASLRAEAESIRAEDAAMCAALGAHGKALLRDGMRVLTHCNAGALATAGMGTALAPIYAALADGMHVEVFADETRPLLQGARLTAWELSRAGVPVTVITDGMAASLMAAGRVDLVLVGADRIAANGDAANKIGTYGIAVLARHHKIPFVVIAPSSTVDPHTASGEEIVIEQRAPDEVTHLGGTRVAASGAAVYNPAFDVTPSSLITHIVTEHGVLYPPFRFDHTPITPPPA